MAIPNKHAINIATKGILASDARFVAVKGHIISIIVQEIPIDDHPEGGVDLTQGAPKPGEEKKKKKLIRVIVTYEGEKFIEERVVDEETKVSEKDVNVDLVENKIKISINKVDF